MQIQVANSKVIYIRLIILNQQTQLRNYISILYKCTLMRLILNIHHWTLSNKARLTANSHIANTMWTINYIKTENKTVTCLTPT